jgi:outer membrane immunogenic protein
MRVELTTLLVAAFGAFAPSVFAADLPVKAPVYGPAPVQNWTGPYVGLAVGAKWTDANWATTQLIDPPSPLVGTAFIDASSPDRFRPHGIRLGGYAGYNWQVDRWVLGFEADAAWSDATDTHAGVPGCRIECVAGFPGPGIDSSFVRSRWDASLRARAGYLVMPEFLVYGTGGVAWQRAEVSGTCANSLDDPLCLVSPPFAVKTQTDGYTRTGWTLGAGAERKFGAWLLRGEYRYSDFGKLEGVLFPNQPVADPGADATHYSVRLHTHVVTLGIGYKF